MADKKGRGNPNKTNAMRILDREGVSYQVHYYGDTGAISGLDVANILRQDPGRVYKTLVTQGKGGDYYVFLVPSNDEMDMRKAAKAVGEKSVEMIPVKDLLPLTGYIHGGCSPLGMKKKFTTVIDSSVAKWECILFSGGKIGYQVEVHLKDIERIIKCQYAKIV